MSIPTTALMPLDPAVSPQRVTRVLPIRADLLPDEITAGRNARRTRILLACAVLLVLAILGAWYFYADKQRTQAADDLAAVTGQVDLTRGQTHEKQYTKVTDTITESELIETQLKSAMAQDLPWATLTDSIRATAGRKAVTLTSVIGALEKDPAATTGATGRIGTLSIAGSAKDKRTVAGFVDALSDVDGLDNAYLTAANKDGTRTTFTLTADITDVALCGRFTKTCPSGGN
jgi:Tfp pilus assembly protein PilN